MPYCPDCDEECGMYEMGFICPNCLKLYGLGQAEKFKNFDWGMVTLARNLFDSLLTNPAMRQGKNVIEFFEDGVVITHLEDIF